MADDSVIREAIALLSSVVSSRLEWKLRQKKKNIDLGANEPTKQTVCSLQFSCFFVSEWKRGYSDFKWVLCVTGTNLWKCFVEGRTIHESEGTRTKYIDGFSNNTLGCGATLTAPIEIHEQNFLEEKSYHLVLSRWQNTVSTFGKCLNCRGEGNRGNSHSKIRSDSMSINRTSALYTWQGRQQETLRSFAVTDALLRQEDSEM